ncbi:MAG: hypothetical protein ABUL62_05970 [Myxococcales bacterium]
MSGDRRWALVVAVAVALWFPLTRLDWFHAHEDSTYILRSIEWAAELRAGHLYPRWAPDLYGGYGAPLFLFYAPAIYGIAGLLSVLGLDTLLSLKLVLLCGSILSGLGAYWLILGQARERNAALLGAVAYLAAPYRLGDLYARGDVAEFIGLGLLPVILALYLAAAREPRPSRSRWLAVGAAAVHAALIVTHTILGLWGSVVIGLVVLVRALALVRHGMWRHALPLVVALLCAPGLAGAYIVPALVYRGITHAAAMVAGYYAPQNQWIGSSVLFDEQSVLFGRNFMRIGPILVVAGLATATAAALNFRKTQPAFAWMALCLGLIGLTLPGAVFFWAPGRVPLSQFIQFPWRLLGPAVLSACVALGCAMAAATSRLREQTKYAIAVACGSALLLLLAWPYVSADEMPRTAIASDPDAIRQGVESTTGANEFLPLAVPEPPSKPRSELVAGAKDAEVEFWSSDGSRHTLAIVATKPAAVVDLALYGFPGWGVDTRSGPAAATLDTQPGGLLRLQLPSIGSYQVVVAYGAPPAARWGAALTAFSALTLLIMLFRGSYWWPVPIRTRHADGVTS